MLVIRSVFLWLSAWIQIPATLFISPRDLSDLPDLVICEMGLWGLDWIQYKRSLCYFLEYICVYITVYILTVCVCMCMHAALMCVLFLCTWMQCHPEVRRVHLIPWSWRYRRFWDASQRWEPTSGPLEEWYRSLTAVTAPQLRCFFSISMKSKNSPGTTAQSFSWPTQTHVSRPALFSCLEVALPRPEAEAENWVGNHTKSCSGRARKEQIRNSWQNEHVAGILPLLPFAELTN